METMSYLAVNLVVEVDPNQVVDIARASRNLGKQRGLATPSRSGQYQRASLHATNI